MGYRYNAITGELDFVDTTTSTTSIIQIDTDGGSALPVVGIVNLLGTAAQGISSTGAGNTVTLTISDASEIQKGVSELATDLEAIAGADSTRTIVSTSLKAKLGTQTNKGVCIGAGDNAALTWTALLGDGNIVIGSTAGVPAPAFITSADGSVSIVNGSNSIDLTAGAAVPTSFVSDAGTANPALNILNVLGGNNISTVGAANNLTINVTGTTDHTLQVGNATGSLTSLGAGLTGELLVPITGADPGWSTTSYGDFSFTNFATVGTPRQLSVINLDDDVLSLADLRLSVPPGNGDALVSWEVQGTLFYAAGVDNSVAGDPWKLSNSSSPSGGDALISTTSAGVITLHNDLDVTEGGTGVSTFTDGGILIGNAGGDIQVTAAPTSGQILIGSTGVDPVLGSLTSTGGTLTVTEGAGTLNIDTNASLQTDTGFAAWDAGGPYFDDSVLGTFDLLVAGTGYINNVLVSWTAPQTVTGMTAGNCYWIYIDSAGDIQKTDTYSSSIFTDYICLFECLRDSTPATNTQFTVKENHPYDFPVETSNYLHSIAGTLIENFQEGANITLSGTKKISISGDDELDDHGLETDISDTAGTGVTFRRVYTTAAGKWALQNETDTFSGYYNNAGTPTVLGGSKFGVYKLYVSKDNLNAATPTYFAVLDNAQYNNLGAANTAISNGTVASATNELRSLEMARLGYIVFDQAGDEIVRVIIDKETLRSTSSSSGTNIAALITTNTSLFDAWLSAADTNVQSCLNTLDEVGKGVTPEHAVLLAGAAYAIGATGVGGTGELLVGTAGADPAFGTSANGNFTFTSSTAAASRTLTVTNTDNTDPASHAVLDLVTGGASGGDPYVHWNTGVTEYSAGPDNTDSDIWKLTDGASPSAGHEFITIDPVVPAGPTTYGVGSFRTPDTNGNISVFSFNGTNTGGGSVVLGVTNIEESADAHAVVDIRASTTGAVGTGGMSYVTWVNTVAGSDWYMGMTAASRDMIIGRVLLTVPIINMKTSGEVTMPLQPAFLAFLGTTDTNVTGDATIFQIGSGNALTEIYDQSADFNVNGTYTAPITGRHTLAADVYFNGADTAHTRGYIRALTSNRTMFMGWFNPARSIDSSNNFQESGSCDVDMDAGDTAVFQARIYDSTKTVSIFGQATTEHLTYVSGSLFS